MGKFLNNIIDFFINFLGNLFSFKYKHDEHVINLYIENAKKLDLIFKDIFKHANIDDKYFNLLQEIQKEAMLYLHKDIVQYIEKLRDLIVALHVLKEKMSNRNIDKDEENRLIKLHAEKLKEISNLYKDFYKIYRKQILNDGIDWTKYSKFFDEIKPKNKGHK